MNFFIGLNLAVSLFLLAPIYFIVLILLLVIFYSKSRNKHTLYEKEESLEVKQTEMIPPLENEEVTKETTEEEIAEAARSESSEEDKATVAQREHVSTVLSKLESKQRSTTELRSLLENFSQELSLRSVGESKTEESLVQSRMESESKIESGTSSEQPEQTKQQSEASVPVVEQPEASVVEQPEALVPVVEQPEARPQQRIIAWEETTEVTPKQSPESSRSESGKKSNSVGIHVESVEQSEVCISAKSSSATDDYSSISSSDLRPFTAPPAIAHDLGPV